MTEIDVDIIADRLLNNVKVTTKLNYEDNYLNNLFIL